MSELELIAAALATGALAGATGVAGDAVRDMYGGLRDLLRRRLAGRPEAQQVLDSKERSAEEWVADLGGDLAEVGADRDEEILAAARALLEAAEPHRGHQAYIWNSKGIVVGDDNTITQTFNA